MFRFPPSAGVNTNHAIALSSVPEVESTGSLASPGYPATRSRRLATSSRARLNSTPGENSRVMTERLRCARDFIFADAFQPLQFVFLRVDDLAFDFGRRGRRARWS